MREIPLSNGGAALVDDEDYEQLARWTWSRTAQGYAARYTMNRTFLMHRQVLGFVLCQHVDHRDGNPLNNTKANLRPCTASQNQGNRRKVSSRPTSSRFKGVCFRKYLRHKPWFADIRWNGKSVYLGCFATEEEAARAYDAAARIKYGEFARLNFPDHRDVSEGAA